MVQPLLLYERVREAEVKRFGVLVVMAGWALSCVAGQQVPIRKAGLWEVTLAAEPSAQQRVITVRQCTDNASDELMLLSIVPGQESCGATTVSSRKMHREIKNRCSAHGQKVDTKMELSGDFQQRYEGRYLVSYAGKATSESRRFEGRWLGECRPGMQPGDMVLPNGVTVNVMNEKKRAEGARANGGGHEGHRH